MENLFRTKGKTFRPGDGYSGGVQLDLEFFKKTILKAFTRRILVPLQDRCVNSDDFVLIITPRLDSCCSKRDITM